MVLFPPENSACVDGKDEESERGEGRGEISKAVRVPGRRAQDTNIGLSHEADAALGSEVRIQGCQPWSYKGPPSRPHLYAQVGSLTGRELSQD